MGLRHDNPESFEALAALKNEMMREEGRKAESERAERSRIRKVRAADRKRRIEEHEQELLESCRKKKRRSATADAQDFLQKVEWVMPEVAGTIRPRLIIDAIKQLIESGMTPRFSPEFYRGIERFLIKEYGLGPGMDTARRLREATVEFTQPEGVIPMEGSRVPGEIGMDRRATYDLLGSLDASREFGRAVIELQKVFRDMRLSSKRSDTLTFEEAAENKLAVALTSSGAAAVERLSPASVRLKDVQRLPSTRGLVLFAARNRVASWDVSVDRARLVSMSLTGIRDFLQNGYVPTIQQESIGHYGETSGSSMRLVAGIAAGIRSGEEGVLPLRVGRGGETLRSWGEAEMARMGTGKPHSVRSHLRTTASGTVTEVRRHARGGAQEWEASEVKVRIL